MHASEIVRVPVVHRYIINRDHKLNFYTALPRENDSSGTLAPRIFLVTYPS
ncbi:MAG: hypothetical protein LUG52_09990 [Clostridia bacterium]|nr:hypothetical protein [Clostridia bacterium]